MKCLFDLIDFGILRIILFFLFFLFFMKFAQRKESLPLVSLMNIKCFPLKNLQNSLKTCSDCHNTNMVTRAFPLPYFPCFVQ